MFIYINWCLQLFLNYFVNIYSNKFAIIKKIQSSTVSGLTMFSDHILKCLLAPMKLFV